MREPVRSVRLTFRATPAEADAIRLMADAALMGVSEFLRRRALVEDTQVLRLQSLQAELRRQGGLLKHLAARGQLDPQAVQHALAGWQAALARIVEALDAGQSHHP